MAGKKKKGEGKGSELIGSTLVKDRKQKKVLDFTKNKGSNSTIASNVSDIAVSNNDTVDLSGTSFILDPVVNAAVSENIVRTALGQGSPSFGLHSVNGGQNEVGRGMAYTVEPPFVSGNEVWVESLVVPTASSPVGFSVNSTVIPPGATAGFTVTDPTTSPIGSPFHGFPPVLSVRHPVGSPVGSPFFGFPPVLDIFRRLVSGIESMLEEKTPAAISSIPQGNLDRKRISVDMGSDPIYGYDPMTPTLSKRNSADLTSHASMIPSIEIGGGALPSMDIDADSLLPVDIDEVRLPPIDIDDGRFTPFETEGEAEPESYFKIIFGDFSQHSSRFEGVQNQCCAMSAAALAYGSGIKSVTDWDRFDLNKILLSGDDYYRYCIDALRIKQPDSFSYDLETINLEGEVRFGSESFAVIPIMDKGVGGPHTRIGVLKKAFKKFEENNFFYAILTHRGFSFGIFRVVGGVHNSQSYAFFDSHGRRANGHKTDPNKFEEGQSAILFFKNANDLIYFFLSEYPFVEEQAIYTESEHLVLIPLHFVHDDIPEVNDIPEQNNEITAQNVRIEDPFEIVYSICTESMGRPLKRGQHQCPGIVMFSFIYSTLNDVMSWMDNDLEEIIRLGRKLYLESVAHQIDTNESQYVLFSTLVPQQLLTIVPYNGFNYKVILDDGEYASRVQEESIRGAIEHFENEGIAYGIFLIEQKSYGLIIYPSENGHRYLFFDCHGRTDIGFLNGPYSVVLYFFDTDGIIRFLCRDFVGKRFELQPVRLSRTDIINENESHKDSGRAGSSFQKLICCNGIETDDWNTNDHSHCIALSMSVVLHAYFNDPEKWTENDLKEISNNGSMLHSICNEEAIEKGKGLLVVNVHDYIAYVNSRDEYPNMSLVSHVNGPPRISDHFWKFAAAFAYFYHSDDLKFAILTINREQTYAICKCSNGSFAFYDPHGRHQDGKYGGDLSVAIFFQTLNQLVSFLGNENEDEFIFSLEYILVREDAEENPSTLKYVSRAITGSFAQNDVRFRCSRNTQCSGNAVVFLAHSFLLGNKWTSSDIDAILIQGNEIYRCSYNEALKKGPRTNTYLAAHEVQRNIPVQINRLERGLVHVDCHANADQRVGKREESGNFGLRAKTSIPRFFRNHTDGVFICSDRSVALSKIGNEYILFDPHACSIDPSDRSYGKANIFCFKDVNALLGFLPHCNFSASEEFTLTPFRLSERRQAVDGFVPPAPPIDFVVTQTPSITSVRSLPTRKSKPMVADGRTKREREIAKKRNQRKYEKKKAQNMLSSEAEQELERRWNNYLRKVSRTHTANVFGDKQTYLEHILSFRGDNSDDESLFGAVDAVENFLLEEHRRQLSVMDQLKNNAMIPTHFDAYGNHEEIEESDSKYVEHKLSPFDQRCPHCNARYFKEECNTRNLFRTCCNFGEIHSELPAFQERNYPHSFKELMTVKQPVASDFRENILYYNNVCSFASLGATNVHHMPGFGSLGPVMAIEGMIYHVAEHFRTNTTGDNMPTAQLYFLDRDDAVAARGNRGYRLEPSVLLLVENTIRQNHPLSDAYRMLGEAYRNVRLQQNGGEVNVRLEISRNRNQIAIRRNHQGDFGLGSSNEVFAVYTDAAPLHSKNIVVFPTDQPVSSGIPLDTTDPNRDCMMYPILFPFGEMTWTWNLKRRPRSDQSIQPAEGADDESSSQLPVQSTVRGEGSRDPLPYIEDCPDDSASEEEPPGRGEAWRDPPPFTPHVANVEEEVVINPVPGDDSDDDDDDEEEESERKVKKRKFITVREFFCFLFMLRFAFNPLLDAGKLSQQFIIDSYGRAQDRTFEYLQSDEGQRQIRSETYGALLDFVERKKMFAGSDLPGKVIAMPETIVGSPQYMKARYADALALVAKYGKPTYFVTMTCNPMWDEIRNELGNKNPVDHPGVVARVFRAKVKELIKDIHKKHVMGKCLAYVGVIEWQKRSLPHFHLVVFISPVDRPANGVDVDKFVSAEIPNQAKQRDLYHKVTSFMYHHRCDLVTPGTAKCHVARKGDFDCPRHPKLGVQEDPDRNKRCICYICSKNFPRKYAAESELIEGGYPIYRRRYDQRSFHSRNSQMINNQFIVPYNPCLLKKYNCHINVEVTSSLKSIKYLFKYIHKGMDMARLNIKITDNEQIYNEFDHFVDCRYLSAGEAIWKLYDFPMFYQSHTIYRMQVHLENYENVIFHDGDYERPLEHSGSRLIAYFALNKADPEARQYLYNEIPLHYVYHEKEKIWRKRKQGFNKTLGRLYTVDYNRRELYALRLLLLTVKGATSFKDIRTVNGTEYEFFVDAAKALGLLADDSMHMETFKEIVDLEMPYKIRRLFVNMLTHFTPDKAIAIWTAFKAKMIEDYTHKGYSDTHAENLALKHIANLLKTHGKTLTDYGLPEPAFKDGEVQVIPGIPADGGRVDPRIEEAEGNRLAALLNPDQKAIYDEIVGSVINEDSEEKLFFVDGPGGSGKTFLFTTVLTVLLGMKFPALAVAWTGIAASLLKNGRTVHNAFKLPLNVVKGCKSGWSTTSEMAQELKKVKIIVWDEISMTPLDAFTAVDQFLRDLMQNDLPFGGKVVVITGDFRQILPVIVQGTRYDLINNTIKKSELWPKFKKLSLTRNVRLVDPNDIEFAQFLMDVGEDRKDDLPNNNPYYSRYVKIPSECIEPNSIVERIYGKSFASKDVFDKFSKTAIITTLNEDANSLNQEIYNRMTEDVCTEERYLSCDEILDLDPDDEDDYSVEILNAIHPPRTCPHELKLKVNCIVMLLVNLNPSKGLCNGTRLIVTKLYKTCIRAKILDGPHGGEEVLLSRCRMTIDSKELSVKFQRIQIPVVLAFAMTINKSQGQTFDCVGVYLRRPVFAHGQLYVALSRVRSKDKLILQVIPCTHMGKLVPGSDDVYVPNIVYPEIL